jgi:MoaA/NifB/PqqE/SkfB family radical SAM enzyme
MKKAGKTAKAEKRKRGVGLLDPAQAEDGVRRALARSQAAFQEVLRDLQKFLAVAPAPLPAFPPLPSPSGSPKLPSPVAGSLDFKETIERIACTHTLEAGESTIEIAREDDGLVRLDIGVIAGAMAGAGASAIIEDGDDNRLTLRLDSTGTERSRPAFQHTLRIDAGITRQRVYLPLRKGMNRIRISGATVQSFEARTPDCTPSNPPNQLIVPITSYCNFQCVMCPHGLPGGVKDKAHFPDAVADLLIAELNAYEQSCDVALTGLGESFMSPGFVRFVEVVKNPLIKFNFTTNGSMLTAERIAWILSSKIWRVNVSLDAGTPETFFKIRRSDWSKVVRNLEALAEAAAASSRRDFWLELNMTLMRENLEDIEPFLRLASRLKASAYLAYLNDYDCNGEWVVEHDGFVFDYQRQILRGGAEVTGKIARARALAKELGVPFNMETGLRPLLDIGPAGRRIETDAKALAARTPPISHCPAPWATDMEAAAVVHADGGVAMCCLQAPIGNILLEGGLMGVWQGPAARSVRQMMLAGVIPQPCAAANCSFVAAQRAWSRKDQRIEKVKEPVG